MFWYRYNTFSATYGWSSSYFFKLTQFKIDLKPTNIQYVPGKPTQNIRHGGGGDTTTSGL